MVVTYIIKFEEQISQIRLKNRMTHNITPCSLNTEYDDEISSMQFIKLLRVTVALLLIKITDKQA